MLYLALRGRLTTQNPLEDTGFSLIENNKRILGTYSIDLKKRVGKGCKPITPKDCLFEIPKTWCWERFGNLVVNFDSLRKPVTKSERKRLLGQYDYYGATGAIDRVDDYIFDGDYLMIGEDGGNFFVSRDNSFIARGRFWANNHVHVVQPIICDIAYLKRCLDAYDLPKMGLVYGIGAPKLNQENLNSIPIPVPPLAEQHRIVARIEQAFSALDTIDALQAKYADNLAVLKSKLIDAAIQGKLTEQLPEDGTAEDLYRQIQAEKQALIKAGKIKKEKPLPPITADEIPLEIPSNWKWVRIGTILTLQSGKNIPASNIETASDEAHKIPCYGGNGQRGFVDCANVDGFHAIIGRQGALCGNINFAEGPFYATEHAVVVYGYAGTNMKWVGMTLRYLNLNQYATSVAQPGLAVSKVEKVLIPLPPLAEQKRIVAKLEELLPRCERLK